MWSLFKLFVGLLLLLFIVPMLWFVIKEVWWLFGGLFSNVGGFTLVADGQEGWFLLTLFFIGCIILIASIDD